MSVFVDIDHALGQLQLSVSFTAGAGLTAILGQSGAGKTSLLNVIAGVARPNRGVVRVDDEVLVDTAAGVWRDPHVRRIGYVFQQPRLFPHLTVRRNLLYGDRFAGKFQSAPLQSTPRRFQLDDIVQLLELAPLLARLPAKLSGGEAQRVALGRALLSQPRLLLLDEPLASVDVARRNEVLPYLDRVRAEANLPTIYVTHTLSEVESRAEQIIVLERGRIRESSFAAHQLSDAPPPPLLPPS